LDFLIFPDPPKAPKLKSNQKSIREHESDLKMLKLLQVSYFSIKKRKIQNSEKTTCQKVVAMVMPNLMDKDLVCRIVHR